MDKNKTTFNVEAVEIGVRDLNSMKEFYENTLGLKEVKPSTDNKVYLGDDGVTLVELYGDANLKDRVESDSGLYHVALVYPTKFRLGTVVSNIYKNYPKLFSGTADHIETEAFYSSDPEGNGLELDFDRPKEEWEYDEKGNAKMGSRVLDVNKFFEDAAKDQDESGFMRMGHIHLKGGDIDVANKFYGDILMFDIIKKDKSALFTTIDGYHHRLAINNWESAGAGKRTQGTVGLRSFALRYYDNKFFNKVLENLKNNNIEMKKIDEKTISINDPWDNLIYLILN